MSSPSTTLSTNLKKVITTSLAWKYRVIPKSIEGELLVLWSDQEQSTNQLEVLTGKNIAIEITNQQFIDESLAKHYLKNRSNEAVRELNVDSDNFIQEVIKESHELGCSDIHMEPYQERCRIRMRLDGKLIERYELKKSKYNEYVNKIKIISNLDISEKRLPQDGRILIKENGFQYDIRVSVLPTLFGEKVVLRLLTSDTSNLALTDLGFTPDQLEVFMNAISQTQGMILISGPTGSGKTTTLYAALKHLNKQTANILTIEDPIEYTLEGVNQVQLKEKIGLDFAATLRTFLRQDPDIIMVGEIRDVETAQMAVRAAMTGHLVLSTLHTNSASGIIARLMEMGISDYLIADTLNIAIAQRLIRCLCPACKKQNKEIKELPEALRKYNLKSFFQQQGCTQCHGTGYRGRKSIYEMIPINESNRDSIKEDTQNWGKYNTLKDNAIRMFANGETSLEEIYPYLI